MLIAVALWLLYRWGVRRRVEITESFPPSVHEMTVLARDTALEALDERLDMGERLLVRALKAVAVIFVIALLVCVQSTAMEVSAEAAGDVAGGAAAAVWRTFSLVVTVVAAVL